MKVICSNKKCLNGCGHEQTHEKEKSCDRNFCLYEECECTCIEVDEPKEIN